jgi:hypothetical protein
MFFPKIIRLLFIAIIVMSFEGSVWACDSCSISRAGRYDGDGLLSAQDGRWFTRYMYDNQNWHEKEAAEGHRLHHQGHDFHDKTTEEFHHLTIGNRLYERMIVSVDIPYVIRYSLEVDDHTILGSKQRSQGIGDLQLLGDWRVSQDESSSLSVLGGLKFPTGGVKEENSVGTRFEQEMQPGSGSYDYLIGAAYHRKAERFNWAGNAVYVFKSEGAQDYRFGDLFSTSVVADYLLNPQGSMPKTRLGLDANLQYEQRHKDSGETVKDSGGVVLLLGPTVTIEMCKNFGLTGTFMAPVVQDLGGVHQEQDFIWTLAAKIGW